MSHRAGSANGDGSQHRRIASRLLSVTDLMYGYYCFALLLLHHEQTEKQNFTFRFCTVPFFCFCFCCLTALAAPTEMDHSTGTLPVDRCW